MILADAVSVECRKRAPLGGETIDRCPDGGEEGTHGEWRPWTDCPDPPSAAKPIGCLRASIQAARSGAIANGMWCAMEGPPELVAFCERMYPRLLAVLTLQVGDRGVAEELTQETLARVWQRWSRDDRLRAPEAWAYTVGLNLARSWLRRVVAERRARRRFAQARVVENSADDAQAIAVRCALSTLPPRQRTALILRYYLDQSVDDAANVMQCAPGTVKAATHQALASLRRNQHLFTTSERR